MEQHEKRPRKVNLYCSDDINEKKVFTKQMRRGFGANCTCCNSKAVPGHPISHSKDDCPLKWLSQHHGWAPEQPTLRYLTQRLVDPEYTDASIRRHNEKAEKNRISRRLAKEWWPSPLGVTGGALDEETMDTEAFHRTFAMVRDGPCRGFYTVHRDGLRDEDSESEWWA
ncbi:hypothetical protein K402DRAFT_418901 [Aulographum hederae CBS 113979]|uniref:Uncharacterized protein n=1 Tax=Aulographum hederae CBS 113979 TaxID=1176131 RepID=A0A6G1H778_9PEZI|nr:hypothetical protein K402DRAFT_418901 [Aulographum hederae CBS 113979]